MAKSKADYWLTKDGLLLLQGWARDGLTDEQIAHNMGIVRQTLYEYKKKHSVISDALKSGKEVVDYAVENALLKRALGGDTTAQIFWLKNRKPKQWRDRPIEVDENTAGVSVSRETLATIAEVSSDISIYNEAGVDK